METGSRARDAHHGSVRSDIEVLSRAGLDVATYVAEVRTSLAQAVPHVAACMCTVDPATHLLTGTFKFGDLYGNDAHDLLWGLIEYGGSDPTSFTSMVSDRRDSVALHLETGGELRSNERMDD